MVGVSPTAASALPDFVAVRQGVGRPQVDPRGQEGGVHVPASAAVVAVRAHLLIRFHTGSFCFGVSFVDIRKGSWICE